MKRDNNFIKVYRQARDFIVEIDKKERIVFKKCSKDQESHIMDFINYSDKKILSKILITAYPDAHYQKIK